MTNYSSETIIIGNGKSAADRKLGKTIDTFGTVVRLNRFNIQAPYHKYVGSKTDIWFTGAHPRSNLNTQHEAQQANDTWRNPELYQEVIHYGEESKPEGLYDYSIMRNACGGVTKLSYVPADIPAYVRLRMHPYRWVKPSSGLVCITYFICCRDCEHVYILGFDNMEGGYYYGGLFRRGIHNPKAERKYIDTLTALGHIKTL